MFCLVPAGCGGSGRQDAGPQTKVRPSAQAKADKPVAAEESVADLFAKGQRVEGMSYEYILTASGGVMKGQVWLQGNRFKTDSVVNGQRIISFFDKDTNTVTTYYPDRNKAVRLSAGRQPKAAPTPGEYTGGVDPAKVRILGTEVYDGERCRIVLVPGARTGEEIRMWVREDYGLPMRVEVTPAQGGKTVMEYKNLRVGNLPPDIFQLPPGVEVTDLNKMMEHLPGVTANEREH